MAGAVRGTAVDSSTILLYVPSFDTGIACPRPAALTFKRIRSGVASRSRKRATGMAVWWADAKKWRSRILW